MILKTLHKSKYRLPDLCTVEVLLNVGSEADETGLNLEHFVATQSFSSVTVCEAIIRQLPKLTVTIKDIGKTEQ